MGHDSVMNVSVVTAPSDIVRALSEMTSLQNSHFVKGVMVKSPMPAREAGISKQLHDPITVAFSRCEFD